MKNADKLLNPREVGDLLGLKPRTVARKCRDGDFETAVKIGRVWRVRRSEVLKYAGIK